MNAKEVKKVQRKQKTAHYLYNKWMDTGRVGRYLIPPMRDGAERTVAITLISQQINENLAVTQGLLGDRYRPSEW